MKHPLNLFVGAAVAAAIVAAAGPASADPVKCHAAIGKNITKYQATLAKTVIGCHKARNGGKAPTTANTDCNDSAGEADLKLKIGATQTKVAASIEKACVIDAVPEATVLAMYPRCPSPVATSDDGGATLGIDTFAELSQCLMDLSEAYVDRMSAQILGSPETIPMTDKENAKCHGALGKALSKAIKTAGGVYTKCHATVEKGSGLSDYGAACLNGAGDSSGKAAATYAAFDALFLAGGACDDALISQADWADMGTCGHNGAKMAECGRDRVLEPTTKGLAAAALELPGTCAAVADVVINAGFGEKLSNSRLDSGWKGTAHYVDVIDQSYGAVSLSGCDADCEDCAVTHNPRNDNCRCDANPTVVCDTINGADLDDCGGGQCNCMFGPPLAISASATPVCVVNRFQADFTGGTSVVGEYDVATSTRALVHTGLSQTRPCPTCDGGICNGGSRNGLACSVDAEHPRFGAVSYDCPPSPGANISGSGLLLDLTFNSGSSSLAAALPAGPECDNGPCHCSVCSGNPQIGCFDDAPCIAAGAGTCGAALANNPSQNNCDTGCSDDDGDLTMGEPEDSDGNGVCDGPIDTFCSGFLNGNGNGIITCSVDADCDANDCNGDNMLTPGECGTCTHAGFRQCFLPTVTAEGTPGIYNSEGVSVFCSGQTGNSGVDNAGGLPGPGRVKLDFDFNLYCADGTTQFQLPAGSNCP